MDQSDRGDLEYLRELAREVAHEIYLPMAPALENNRDFLPTVERRRLGDSASSARLQREPWGFGQAA